MRITQQQSLVIKTLVTQHFGSNSAVWLFGSRTNDSKKGGDIDLYVQTRIVDDQTIYAKNKTIAGLLYQEFGEQKIDIIIHQTNKNTVLPIYLEAQKTGIKVTKINYEKFFIKKKYKNHSFICFDFYFAAFVFPWRIYK